jgi:hypothetical protein
MICYSNKQCCDCGNYYYDTFHKERICNIHNYAYGYQQNGVDCDDWVCQYKKWSEDADKKIVEMKKQIEELKSLYEAEKILRKAAENNK